MIILCRRKEGGGGGGGGGDLLLCLSGLRKKRWRVCFCSAYRRFCLSGCLSVCRWIGLSVCRSVGVVRGVWCDTGMGGREASYRMARYTSGGSLEEGERWEERGDSYDRNRSVCQCSFFGVHCLLLSFFPSFLSSFLPSLHFPSRLGWFLLLFLSFLLSVSVLYCTITPPVIDNR